MFFWERFVFPPCYNSFAKIAAFRFLHYSFNENNHLINIMTFHSAKGLDFENVFIPFANKSLYINLSESIAKTLFMVAMTRTRKNLYITYTGSPIEILNTFESKCLRIDIPTAQSTPAVENNSWGF